jgi:hypothetical protein
MHAVQDRMLGKIELYQLNLPHTSEIWPSFILIIKPPPSRNTNFSIRCNLLFLALWASGQRLV